MGIGIIDYSKYQLHVDLTGAKMVLDRYINDFIKYVVKISFEIITSV
jgi:hypothetical protein